MAIFYQLSLAFMVLIFLEFSSTQGEYTYLGCYWDDMIRALPDLVSCDPPCICSNSMTYCQTTSMTVYFCLDLCKSKTFKYAGLQAGTQCFCGNEDAVYTQHGEATLCATPCSGNSSQVCGDVYRNSVYDTLYRPTGCPPPNPIAKGWIATGEKAEYFEGDSISYICEGTAFMLGDPTRTCLASGMWDNPSPECRTVCNEQVPPLGSNRGTPIPVEESISSISVEGEQYVLPCLTGYTGTSEFILATCQSDGTWNFNSTDLTCEVVVCDITGLGEGVIVMGNDFTYLSTVTFTCDVGYVPSSDTRQCKADGTWSGMEISCILVFCSPPSVADGASISPGPYNYGESVTYFCVNQYATLIGDSTRMCTADGSWSGQEPICQTDTTKVTTYETTQRPTTTRVRTTRGPATTMQPLTTTSETTTKSATTTKPVTTTQSATTMQLMSTVHRTTSASKTSIIPSTTNREDNLQPTSVNDNMSSANEMSTPDVSMTSLNVSSSSQYPPPSTTSDGFNEKAKSDKSPADFMVLIVIIACIFSVLFLAIIFAVACVKSPRRGKVQVTKQINFVSSKETGSMNDILWSDDLSPDSPRSRADSGLPPSDRNSPSSNDSPDGSGAGGVVNLAFENDDVFKTQEDDPYHRIEFSAVNESNNVSSVLMNSGIMSPPPQTQDDRKPINHSRANSFQQPDDVESLYARVDMSKKTNRSRQNGVDRTQSTLSDYKSVENPLYQSPSPKSLLEPVVDNGQMKSNGGVGKTSRRTPSDVSVSSRSYWAQYEEQVTRL